MSRILLGSFPVDAHDDVRIALMAVGHEVYVVEDVEGLVTAALVYTMPTQCSRRPPLR